MTRPHSTLKGPTSIVVALVFAGGCFTAPVPRVSVRSEDYPAIEIECRGGPVPAAVCVAWGDDVLGGSPDLSAQTVRLVLALREGNRRCAAEFYGPGGQVVGTSAVVCARWGPPTPTNTGTVARQL